MAPKQVNDDDIAGSRGASLQQMLQLSVQRLQWTYSLFWQLCPQQEALVWADGHYNGVIKTRKMVQPVETTAEEVALQRSQQLRELYESLSMGEDSQPSRRPCAALSPEDLTESEWFYLMCISFVFPPGVGLPGRAFEKKQPLWLAGANEVDSKVFSRAILAKGAQIQTVVCIPIVDGVLELGNTDRVEEDPDLIQLMKSFFSGYHHQRLLQGERPTVSEQSTSTPSGRQRHLQPAIPSPVPPADIHRGAGDDDHDHDDEDDEELDSSSDAGAVEEGEKPAGSPREMLQMQTSEEILLGSPDDGSNDIDADLQLLVMSQEEELYSQTVSTILQRNANRWGETCSSGNPLDLPRQSAFCAWTGGATADSRRAQQWMLKQALRGIPRLYSSGRSRKSGASPAEELSASHVLAERRRREKLNERFITLRSMVPCVTKMDKASILADTIEYLKKLLRRIQELEGKIKSMEMERRARGGGGGGGVAAREEPEKKKIKGMDLPLGFTGETSVQVSIIEADALLELRCPDREGLLLRMMQRIHELGLESIAVKSSVSAGLLIAQIRAKVENPAMGRTVSIADVQKALYGLISP